MSTHTALSRHTVTALRARKGAGSLVSLTAYSAPMARLVDAHADVIIVGDSLGMVLYGMPSTLGVTLEMMIAHGAAVVRGSTRACVVVDLPFGTYQESPAQAFRSAARLLSETGAQAVKLEGGVEMADTIRFLTERGVPVMAHIGLMPQQANATGGFKAQGLEAASAARIFEAARAVEQAGAFSVVIEGTAEALARHITETLAIPTIGIGASAACDGQVLVTEDMVGGFDAYTPRFVKRYADINAVMREAVAQYADEVRQGAFPLAQHCFGYGKPLQLPSHLIAATSLVPA
ncbi:3-methyl-2-oxobutanoate hydroxymethyltransferase [Ralstonia insidiosa]|jgi:3-methyl-2-oxobutanoate hydroxymethyltransferase|uniref:3-methyl-2-oxobutanoate hydroxymethyltransferase n=1 Tax=Ralstonia TaxID=48736 RepID=UPI000664B6EB|nr:3-methyl-2-oxobutanoate hydroxymethyltransferase [Ralstonia insidiosa]KMW44092.1 3-methyl-2-oxobutanoate hydroxymethyltransferase [Ralstonia sp. MD27]MBX3771643.1 3-methyl-2-oxobutanoate hydroxymethyltransferase [Ralstonia pickettii]NOZ14892.1 3-methyl-2-oxobutanoate hydroxymethyltransferase [Betaproteobacteria bacterium]MBA9858619.1 3-methyl-2-oxobutanoate hydroxymethyltransferase [Ralstonia insidiosa]MBA9871723.1 3-methyl-2-oxobutanoate hydroxymethyltransferase [Ralstonia insidiosa]